MNPENLIKHQQVRQNILFQRHVILVFKVLLIAVLVVIVLTSISAIG